MVDEEQLEYDNEIREERYAIVMERILEIYGNEASGGLDNYFKSLADIFSSSYKLYTDYLSKIDLESGCKIDKETLEQCKKEQAGFYGAIMDEAYNTSPANSAYILDEIKSGNIKFNIADWDDSTLTNSESVEIKIAYYLAWLSSEVGAVHYYAYENKKYFITVVAELFMQVYMAAYDEYDSLEDLYNEFHDIAYWYAFDYADVFIPARISEQVIPEYSLGTRLINSLDFKDEMDLYAYGECITDNEIKLFNYLNSLSDDDIDKMARTYVDGYITGFVKAGKPIDKKKTVNIRYHIGQERIVKRAVELFNEHGLEPIIYRRGINVFTRNVYRVGYTGAVANAQYDYDHKNDKSIFYDKKYAQRLIEVTTSTHEEFGEYGALHAGPAVIETFGEEPFTPLCKESVINFTDKQEKIAASTAAKLSELTNKFIPGEERSFTIISFPLPSIGDRFEEIFMETLKLNTLDANVYETIQNRLIDTLDKGKYARIRGCGQNKTDLTIALADLKNPDKETIFENCVADVNIPVGEVFTSPKLEGTNGTLHVTSVYLNELLYKDLKIEFKDGMITEYSCDDGESDHGKKYIKNTILNHRDTLPMGEFAIGTNTTAYAMARVFNIEAKMPILIAEKTGPHFAIGDTCYSHEEDVPVYNPNGKEIIARENSCSALRNTNPDKAYFQCHTDITIPYDELGSLCVVTENGEEIPIIIDGRFVLDGTEELNEAFED